MLTERLRKAAPALFGLAAMLNGAAMQFFLFAFIARKLGPDQYGLYLAILSFAPILFELVGWGAGEYLISRSSYGEDELKRARGHLYSALAITIVPVSALYIALTVFLMPESAPWALVIIAVGEFLGFRLLVNAEQTAIAHRSFGLANIFRGMQALPRVAGVLAAAFLGVSDAVGLAVGGSLGLLIGGVLTDLFLQMRIPSGGQLKWSAPAARTGGWFAGTQLMRASQQNIDRVVLGAVSDSATLALYGASQRFVQIGMLPVQAILRTTYPNFFREGQNGVRATVQYAIKVSAPVLGVALGTAVAVAMLSGLVVPLIGPQYADTATYLFFLAPNIVVLAATYVAADALSGSGRVRPRLILAIAGVALQAGCYFVFRSGVMVVLATYIGSMTACVLTWAYLLITSRAAK